MLRTGRRQRHRAAAGHAIVESSATAISAARPGGPPHYAARGTAAIRGTWQLHPARRLLMRRVLALVVLSLSACAVPPSPETATEVDEVTVGGPTTNTTCISSWECDPICGFFSSHGILVPRSTNVLHRYCDDGSDTVVRTNACGQECF
jgi:hypothetical protein